MSHPGIKVIFGALALLLALPSASAALLDGELTITNDRRSIANVSIDGRRTVSLNPFETRLIRAVPNGVRLLRISSQGVPTLKRRVSIPVQGRSVFRVPRLHGRAAITNHSGVRMKLFVARRFIGAVGPGKTLISRPLPLGTYQLKAKPAGAMKHQGPAMFKTITIRPLSRSKVTLGRWFATLKVRNPYTRPAGLVVNGRFLGRVKAGKSLTFTRYTPGTHTVSLVHRRRVLVTKRLSIASGSSATWNPLPALRGNLSLTNNSRRFVSVRIDRMFLGTLSPGQTRVFTNLPAGSHRLVRWSERGFKSKRRITIPPGRQVSVTIRQGFNPHVRRGHLRPNRHWKRSHRRVLTPRPLPKARHRTAPTPLPAHRVRVRQVVW